MRVGKRETKRGNRAVKLKKENLDRETIKKGKRQLRGERERERERVGEREKAKLN